MTEEQIKEMLKDIIDNDAEYEIYKQPCQGNIKCLHTNLTCSECKNKHSVKEKYKLGDEIHSDWDYRKVENWSVIEWNDTHTLEVRTLRDAENTIGAFIQITFKTKEECEKWIEEHTKKTWLEEYLENYFTEHTEYSLSRKGDLLGGIRIGTTEVCKKILEEANKIGCKDTVSFIKEIIKDLGVEV